MSNELTTTDVVIKVIETKPAVVNFNYQEIADHLDSVLVKYQGLVFTEDTAAGCKKTIAELRKGQTALDTFRKTTKADLTKSVTAFENQCKTLFNKFEEVIKPLTLQADQFEADRKEEKRSKIQSLIDALIPEKGLAEKYASQLIIPEAYLNKGKAITAIKTELTALATSLRTKQDKEEQDVNLVKMKVELANARCLLKSPLQPEPYARLLSYKTVAEIDEIITADAGEAMNREKKAAELAAAKTVEVPVEPIRPVQVNPVSFPQAPVFSSTPTEQERPRTLKDRMFEDNAALLTAMYEITGTEEQLSALEEYLDASGLLWTDRA
jgi:hypothetical protein